ncbi:MAG: NAD-dependent deacylase [Spirochaetaceae bacterium]|nr:MAG: NAD-dependent deacylase [Spirochaetaceae bacterium]
MQKPNTAFQHEITRLQELVREATHIVVLTGAGISAESGIPTFRDAQTGYWSRFRPEDLATPEAFRRDPELVWRWYAERRAAVRAAKPNAGHLALSRMEADAKNFTLITQNVDSLHARAGSQRLIEIHGNILRVRCFAGCVSYSDFDQDNVGPDTLELSGSTGSPAPGGSPVPRCPECGDYLRPDVVWFGENLSEAEIERAFDAAEQADLFLSIGTSAVVYPAAMLPQTALESGATVVEINPQETALSALLHLSIRGTAAEVLPQVVP